MYVVAVTGWYTFIQLVSLSALNGLEIGDVWTFARHPLGKQTMRQ